MKKISYLLIFFLNFLIVGIDRCNTTPPKVNPNIKVYFNDAINHKSNGIDTALVELIKSAKSEISAHFFSCDKFDIRDALINAKKKGVNIRFITDYDNYLDDPYNDKDDYSLCYEPLEKAGIKIITENFTKKTPDTSAKSHNKFLLVDGRYVWTGSYNITYSNTIYDSNDAVKIDSKELYQVYWEQFNKMWGSSTATPNANTSCFGVDKTATPVEDRVMEVGGETVEVCFDPSDGCDNAIVKQIESAERTIDFAIFVFTRDVIAQALAKKASEGVKIRGVIDNEGAFYNGSQYNYLKSQPNITIKLDEDVNPEISILHHKFMIIDGEKGSDPVVITGSKNWTLDSSIKNDENIVIIHSPWLAQEYEEQFEILFNGD